jgi:hypothetical protein
MADNSTAPPATLAAALADRYRIERPNSRIYVSARLISPALVRPLAPLSLIMAIIRRSR